MTNNDVILTICEFILGVCIYDIIKALVNYALVTLKLRKLLKEEKRHG